MYLRNKKTGEVVDWSFVGPTAIKEYEGKDILLERERYGSIEEFISEWEDYAPKEPLIKDEKIRKAVRAWAKMNKLERVAVNPPTEDCSIISFTYGMLEIGFFLGRSDISGGAYTIAELCGEDEE